MILDHGLQIGSTHDICEDYAAWFISNDIGWFMVSDGCSSADEVDFGCRILTKTACNILESKKFSDVMSSAFFESFACEVIADAELVRKDLRLSQNALDASLLLGATDGETIRLTLYGDGYVFVEMRDGTWTLINISYSNNTPMYPNYYANETHREHYLNMFPNDKLIISSMNSISQKVKSSWHKLDHQTTMTFDVEDLKSCSLLTDGLHTFFQNKEKIEDRKIASLLLPGMQSRNFFIKNKFNWLSHWMFTEHVSHHDDLAIAGVVFP